MIPGLADTPELRGPLPARGPGRGRAAPPQHRHRLRPGRGQGPAVHRHGVHRGHRPREDHPEPRAALRGVEARRPAPGLRGPRPTRTAAGIVHRDVKPANIRVTAEGEVKIMDFGIAHLQSSTMTKSGLVLGTVHYMAPEQVEGQKVDHRADIFSVGAIAYELIAYKRPFDGDSLTAVMFKIMHDRPGPAARCPETEYSPGLEEIIMKALARDRATSATSRSTRCATTWRAGAGHADAVGLRVDPALARPPAAPPRPRSRSARSRSRTARSSRTATSSRRSRGCGRRWSGRAPRASSSARSLTSRRLMELAPGDKDAAAAAKQIEGAIQDRQVEQLCETALAYAADGDMELAGKIAGQGREARAREPAPPPAQGVPGRGVVAARGQGPDGHGAGRTWPSATSKRRGPRPRRRSRRSRPTPSRARSATGRPTSWPGARARRRRPPRRAPLPRHRPPPRPARDPQRPRPPRRRRPALPPTPGYPPGRARPRAGAPRSRP